MNLIISHDDVVMDWGEVVSYRENGNPYVNERLAYDKSIVKSIVEVKSIPSDITFHKYKYTTKDGFTSNEHWIDPEESILDPVELKKKMALMQQAIDGIIMGGVL